MRKMGVLTRQMTGKWAGAALLGLAMVAGIAPAVAAQSPVSQRQLQVDEVLNTLERDPDVTRLLARPPAGVPGPRGPQPFEQQPPAAQSDFSAPPPPAPQGGGPVVN